MITSCVIILWVISRFFYLGRDENEPTCGWKRTKIPRNRVRTRIVNKNALRKNKGNVNLKKHVCDIVIFPHFLFYFTSSIHFSALKRS